MKFASMMVCLPVEDSLGHKAYTDPIWVDAVASPFGAGAP
jgi:hypothetical protein